MYTIRTSERGLHTLTRIKLIGIRKNSSPDPKRTLIGKVDPVTGRIVPTRPYKRRESLASEGPTKTGPLPIKTIQRSFDGATYLFDEIGKATGIADDLMACFPDTYRQILSVAYYLILDENNSLSRFSRWQKLHIHPYGQDIPSQRSSELFQSMDEEGRMSFFKRQGKRRIEREYWAFDITSISSYSDTLSQVKKGNCLANNPGFRSTTANFPEIFQT